MSAAVAPPPIPAGLNSWPVTRDNGVKTRVVTVEDAGKLVDKPVRVIREWIRDGALETTQTTRRRMLVLVDSLWAQVPEEFDRP